MASLRPLKPPPEAGPAHVPYADGTSSFGIGLKPLGSEPWIEVDERLGHYLGEKHRLMARDRDEVWSAHADTRDSQMEIRDALVDNLRTHPQQRWTCDPAGLVINEVPDHCAHVPIALDDPAPLLSAAMLVQEDLCLMRRGEDGWYLAAASVCFASSWSLKEKFGRTLDGLHAPVPGYSGQMAQRMARIFDNLRVGNPVWRLNWSLYNDDRLHHPHSHGMLKVADAGGRDPSSWLNGLYMRVERQTLTRMPISGDILFTIRIHVDPLIAIRDHPDRARLASGLRDQLAGLDADQLDYKGLSQHRSRLVDLLDGLTSG